jgi:hypothetical protein
MLVAASLSDALGFMAMVGAVEILCARARHRLVYLGKDVELFGEEGTRVFAG